MSEIMRYEVNEEWAYSGIVEEGDFIFLSFCEGNVGQISGKKNHFHRICEQGRCRRSSNTNRCNSI